MDDTLLAPYRLDPGCVLSAAQAAQVTSQIATAVGGITFPSLTNYARKDQANTFAQAQRFNAGVNIYGSAIVFNGLAIQGGLTTDNSEIDDGAGNMEVGGNLTVDDNLTVDGNIYGNASGLSAGATTQDVSVGGPYNFNNNALNGVGTANVSYVNVGSGGNLSFGSGGSFASDLNGGTTVGSITGTLTGNASSATVAGGLSAGATTQDVTVNGPAAFRAGVTISGTTYLGSSGYVDSGGDAGFHSLDINFTGKGFASNGDVTAGAVNASGAITAPSVSAVGSSTTINGYNYVVSHDGLTSFAMIANQGAGAWQVYNSNSGALPISVFNSGRVTIGNNTADNGVDQLQVAGSIAATSQTLTGALTLGANHAVSVSVDAFDNLFFDSTSSGVSGATTIFRNKNGSYYLGTTFQPTVIFNPGTTQLISTNELHFVNDYGHSGDGALTADGNLTLGAGTGKVLSLTSPLTLATIDTSSLPTGAIAVDSTSGAVTFGSPVNLGAGATGVDLTLSGPAMFNGTVAFPGGVINTFSMSYPVIAPGGYLSFIGGGSLAANGSGGTSVGGLLNTASGLAIGTTGKGFASNGDVTAGAVNAGNGTFSGTLYFPSGGYFDCAAQPMNLHATSQFTVQTDGSNTLLFYGDKTSGTQVSGYNTGSGYLPVNIQPNGGATTFGGSIAATSVTASTITSAAGSQLYLESAHQDIHLVPTSGSNVYIDVGALVVPTVLSLGSLLLQTLNPHPVTIQTPFGVVATFDSSGVTTLGGPLTLATIDTSSLPTNAIAVDSGSDALTFHGPVNFDSGYAYSDGNGNWTLGSITLAGDQTINGSLYLGAFSMTQQTNVLSETYAQLCTGGAHGLALNFNSGYPQGFGNGYACMFAALYEGSSDHFVVSNDSIDNLTQGPGSYGWLLDVTSSVASFYNDSVRINPDGSIAATSVTASEISIAGGSYPDGLISTDNTNGVLVLGDGSGDVNDTAIIIDDANQQMSLTANNGIYITGPLTLDTIDTSSLPSGAVAVDSTSGALTFGGPADFDSFLIRASAPTLSAGESKSWRDETAHTFNIDWVESDGTLRRTTLPTGLL